MPQAKKTWKNHLIEETYVRELNLWWSAWDQTQTTQRGTSNPLKNKQRRNIEN